MSGSLVDVHYDHGGLAVATCDRILLTYVAAEITSEYLARADRAGSALGKRFDDRIGSLTLVPFLLKMPGSDLRAEAKRMTERSNRWVGAGATILGQPGFWASTARSLLTAMTLFQGGPPRRVFAATGPAIAWLALELKLGANVSRGLHVWSDRTMEQGLSEPPPASDDPR